VPASEHVTDFCWIVAVTFLFKVCKFTHKNYEKKENLTTEPLLFLGFNKAYRKRKQSEGNSYSLKKGKWKAETLVNILRMVEIRSNLHTGL